MTSGAKMRPAMLGICMALAAVILGWNATEGGAMSAQQNKCGDDATKLSEMFRTLFAAETPPDILSCSAGGTPWASFSHVSAEVAPASFDGIAGFEPLNDPGWFPMDLMPDDYRRAFEGADWTKVLSAQSFDPQTKARIFLIRSPDDRAFIVTTSE